ncbi:MAG TPA: hypothetical protein VMM93_09495 [Vicinamibacterales bacterium]|nr:hypothetical protein [Vicinamibacterales bacterium]
MRRLLVVPVAVATVLTPIRAGAQTTSAPAAQSIRVGATIFYDYTYTARPKVVDADGHAVSAGAFDVKRTYLNITGTVSPLISFRITPDIRRETGAGSSLNGSLNFRLKYAYVQFALDEWLPAGARVRAGMHQTPFIESQEGVYRYRFQGTLYAERDGGLSSADMGVSFRTPLPSSYGDVQVSLFNGEGYTRPEVNDQKSVQLRATVRPLPQAAHPLGGLRVTAFYNHDAYLRDAGRRRFIASAMFEHARFNAGFDVLTGTDQLRSGAPELDSRGLSFFVTPFFDEKGTGFEGLLRYDYYRANVDLNGAQKRLIVGGAYWFPHPGGPAIAALLLDYEQVSFSGALAGQPRQRRIGVHGLINF